MPLKFCWLCSNSPLSRWQRISLPPSMARRFGAVRLHRPSMRTGQRLRKVHSSGTLALAPIGGRLAQVLPQRSSQPWHSSGTEWISRSV